jgi:two-component system sensor histidine kinase RegB
MALFLWPLLPDRAADRDPMDRAGIGFDNRVRLGSLVTLRWIALLGQGLALLVIYFGLGYDFEIFWAAMVVAVSVAFNLFLIVLFPAAHQLPDKKAAMQLGFDLVQLALLLSFTGGLSNPFSSLLLVPVTISATVLSRKSTWALLVLALGLSILMARWHLPLPWPDSSFTLPAMYRLGLWMGLAVAMIFLTLYAARISVDTRKRSQALAATEAALEREHKLAELGTLAAAAAHELGTPLGTITLAARELLRETPEGDPRHEDVLLINDQISRCRGILERLSYKDLSDEAFPFAIQTIEALAHEAARAFEYLTDVVIDVEAAPLDEGNAPQPVISRRAEILHALTNFIENAVGFARSRVLVRIGWSSSVIEVIIKDDGPGFDPSVQKNLGEPYVTTRRRGTEAMGAHHVNATGDTGLGLGVFIAKTLLERTGATVRFVNDVKSGGAVVKILWQKEMLAPEDKSQSQAR